MAIACKILDTALRGLVLFIYNLQSFSMVPWVFCDNCIIQIIVWIDMTRINIHWFSCKWKIRLSCFEILCSALPCNILPLMRMKFVFDSNSLSLNNLRIYNIMAATRLQFSTVLHHIIWYIGTNVWEKLVAFYFQTFLPWSWAQQVGPRCRYQSTKPSVVTSWKTVSVILTAVRTIDFIQW